MKNKLAKIKYLPNNFEIIEDGDHVICAISQKKILIDKNETKNSLKRKILRQEHKLYPRSIISVFK